MAITITEALAETKTIAARIAKRQQTVTQYLARDARMRDPLEAEGGSMEFIRRERQGITDLETRLVSIRTAIQRKNLETPLTVRGVTRTVAEWLNWRRELSDNRRKFLGSINSLIQGARQNAARQGAAVVTDVNAKPGDIIVAVSEGELAAEIEEFEAVLGELDGKLSLMNATTMIEV